MQAELRARIQEAVQGNPVVLYMKGTRARPQCGFSASVVGILDGLLADYLAVDVLADAALREGVKEYSSWPTIPQLYVRGEFVGGADIVAALFESGELVEKLAGLNRPAPPRITLSDSARAELSSAIENETECIRLDVSPSFEHDLAVGVPDPHDLVLDIDGLRLSLPPAAARRADGLHVDLVMSPEGAAFKLNNPNEPARVRRITPAELSERLARKDDLLLLDTRTDGERAIAEIPGGRAFDEELAGELETLPKGRPIVCYCHHGHRSQRAAEELVLHGFREVYNLAGGIDAWSLEVDPGVERY